jgi:hypothetical protein
MAPDPGFQNSRDPIDELGRIGSQRERIKGKGCGGAVTRCARGTIAGGDHLAGPEGGDAPRKGSTDDRPRLRGVPTQQDEEEEEMTRWVNHA